MAKLTHHRVKGCGPLTVRDTWETSLVRNPCIAGRGVILSGVDSGWSLFVRFYWADLTWELCGYFSPLIPRRNGRAATEEELLRAGIAALEDAEDFVMASRKREQNSAAQPPLQVAESKPSAPKTASGDANLNPVTKTVKTAAKKKPRAKSGKGTTAKAQASAVTALGTAESASTGKE